MTQLFDRASQLSAEIPRNATSSKHQRHVVEIHSDATRDRDQTFEKDLYQEEGVP